MRSDSVPTPSRIRASSSTDEPSMSPPPDEFSSTRRTSGGDDASTAPTFSTIRLRPVAAPTPRCEPMWVFTIVAP